MGIGLRLKVGRIGGRDLQRALPLLDGDGEKGQAGPKRNIGVSQSHAVGHWVV